MYNRKMTTMRVLLLWLVLFCFAWLQFQQGSPILLVFLCACLSLSLGVLATFVLILQTHKLAENERNMRALGEGLYLYFLTSIFTICFLSAPLRQTPSLGMILPSLFMGALVIGSAVWVVLLGMRVLRALEDKSGGE